MVIIDQNFNEILNYHKLDWDDCGSFASETKINQISMALKHTNLVDFHNIMIVTDPNVDVDAVNASDVGLVVINFSDHPYDYWDYQALTKPYLILHWDFRSVNHHPYHLIYSSVVSDTDLMDFKETRPYVASVVNGKPRVHRIYALLKLHNYWFFNQLQKTWRHVSEYNCIPDWDLEDIKFSDLTEFEWAQFYQLQNSLPDTPILTEELSCAMIGPGFSDSYLNLVTEASCENNGFLTEKIYKPIRAGQLFLVQGPPGAVSAMRHMGFDVFDDYFNHGSYDDIENWRSRTDAVIAELARVYDRIPDIWQATVERRIKNVKLLQSGVMFQRCLAAFDQNLIINI